MNWKAACSHSSGMKVFCCLVVLHLILVDALLAKKKIRVGLLIMGSFGGHRRALCRVFLSQLTKFGH